jgi:hypothetical protein
MVATNRLLVLPLLATAMLLGAFRVETGQQKSPPHRSIQDSIQRNLTKDLEDDEDGAVVAPPEMEKRRSPLV